MAFKVTTALLFLMAVTSSLAQENLQPNEVELPPDYKELGRNSTYYPSSNLNLVQLGGENGKKYFFSTNENMTWHDALTFCVDFDMDLLTIETKQENDLIVAHIASIGFTGFHVFTSSNKIGRGTYMWLNGEYMMFEDWDVGEPAHFSFQNVLIVWLNHWYDTSAHIPKSFICEERSLENQKIPGYDENNKQEDLAVLQNEMPTYYPSSTLTLVKLGGPLQGKNYFVSTNENMTWFAARTFCYNFGMDLVSVEAARENELLVEHIANIGMTDIAMHTSGNKIGRSTYMWLNGEYMMFEDWDVGQPAHFTTENCLALLNNHWHDVDCAARSAFICEERSSEVQEGNVLGEREQRQELQDGSLMYYPSSMLNLVKLGGPLGKNYFFSTNQYVTWFEARSFCNNHAMDLVSVETARENDLLVEYIAQLGLTSAVFHTSGNKIGRSTYIWLNGEYMIFEDWGVGEPANLTTENCLAFLFNHWFDVPCHRVSSFICEERS